MKNAFVIVTLSGLLSACALAPRQDAVAPAPASPPAPVAAPEPADIAAVPEVAPAAEKLPAVALTPELMYRILKAELEFKGGAWQAPYVSLLGMAQQTRDPRLARRAAELALTAKQPAESIAAIRLWRELAPESEEAAQYYLSFAILSDQLGEAEAIFVRRLKEAPTPSARGLAMFQIQQFLTSAKDKAAAGALLERVLAPYGAMSEAHIVLAQAAYTRGATALALKEAQAALALQPDSEMAVLTLSQVNPDQSEVTALLGKFLASNPGAREARAALARVLVERKQYGPARLQFETLLKDQPDHLPTLYALGIMSMQLDESAAAERYFTHFIEVLAASPDDERDPGKVLMILAQLAEERNDYKAALGWLEKVDPEQSKLHFGAQLKRAQLIGKQGDLDGAQKLLDGVVPDQPSDQAQLVLARGQILRDAGKAQAAYTVLEDGARRYPANPDLLYDFALMAEKTGRLEVMESTLRAVIAQAPDNHHAYNALGYSLAERNVRLPEALELIDKALKMAPGDPFIMDSMGWVQYRLGNLPQAEAHLRRAYALRSDPEIAVHLGEVLWHMGQKADAQKLWRAARSKDPKNDTLKDTLARLHLSL
ncbi:MAG: tetratricopeptide repeat protein [Pseudomonadota bacterium]